MLHRTMMQSMMLFTRGCTYIGEVCVMGSPAGRNRRNGVMDMSDTVEAVHRQARQARSREIGYRVLVLRNRLVRCLTKIGQRLDKSIFSPYSTGTMNQLL